MKTKTVSSSMVVGVEGYSGKRLARDIPADQPAPPKVPRPGFGLSLKKTAPISIKLGASVSETQ